MVSKTQAIYDVAVIGAGIVGMTVAFELKQRMPLLSIIIIDKEEYIGMHASGRNSGVLHSGIYYANDTLKAKVCAQGLTRMVEFAQEHNIPYLKLGKVLLANSEQQLPVVDRLMNNAKINGVKAYRINQQELFELEPAAAQGPAAIYCPDTTVIDSITVLNKLYLILKQLGVTFLFGCHIKKFSLANQLSTHKETIHYGFLFNCAGAHADKIARAFNLAQQYALIPFKGIYWKLNQTANSLVRSNIYPVPDISLPFLGIHFTRVVNGDVYVGPTAIPVFGRENYKNLQGISIREAIGITSQLIAMYWYNKNNFRLLAKNELAKYQKKYFLNAAQKLLPSLSEKHLEPTPKVGIRPQLINIETKVLEMDYIFEHTNHSLHVLNAISPAFTSSFAFAKLIVDRGFDLINQ